MSKKKKYYVVWKGRKPGIYHHWKECKAMIDGYKNAQYKSFLTLPQAKKAFNSSYLAYKGKKKAPHLSEQEKLKRGAVDYNSIAVDAASSGNPGLMEYRGVDTRTKNELFHIGPYEQGTNNIGEFLAIVHGLALLKNKKSNRILYTDSRTAMSWVRRKKCNTKLQKTKRNARLFKLVDRAEKWLKKNDYNTPVVKWETRVWGEIPADFGRK